MNIREALIAKLDELSEQDIAELMQRADDLLTNKKRREAYDPAKDPFLNGEFSFEAIPSAISVSDHTEDILNEGEYYPQKGLPADYDPDKDPSVGFFAASPDLGHRTKAILRAEFGLRKPQDNDEKA